MLEGGRDKDRNLIFLAIKLKKPIVNGLLWIGIKDSNPAESFTLTKLFQEFFPNWIRLEGLSIGGGILSDQMSS